MNFDASFNFDINLEFLIYILNFIQVWNFDTKLDSGEDTVNANESLAGTSFDKIVPDHSKKVSVSTIKGISNYFTFMWPYDI